MDHLLPRQTRFRWVPTGAAPPAAAAAFQADAAFYEHAVRRTFTRRSCASDKRRVVATAATT